MNLKVVFNKNKIVYLFLILLICGVSFFMAYNMAWSERFGDETAHMTGGHLILQGHRLYTDIQLNHQPLNYFISSATEVITRPQNLYQYISRQRFAIAGYSIIWNIIFLVFFGPISLLVSAVFEPLKFYLQGYKLLGETVAVYPLMAVIMLTIKSLFGKKKLTKTELILYSISSFIAVFSLIPIAIVIFFSGLAVLYYQHKKIDLIYLIFPFLLLSLVLFSVVSFRDYIKEAIIYNYKYFIPNSGLDLPTPLLFIFMPLYSFVLPFNNIKIFFIAFMAFYCISIYFSYRKGQILKLFYLLFIIVLSNFFRSVEQTLTNFHLLPYVGLFFTVDIVYSYYLFKNDRKFSNLFYFKIVVIVILAVLNLTVLNNHYLKPRDKKTEFYNNYSETESYGMAVKIIKSDNDKLIALPNDPLINYVSNTDIGTRMIEYYPWTYFVPEYKDEIIKTFKHNLPPFIVFSGNYDIPILSIERVVAKAIEKNYVRLKKTGQPSALYIRTDRYKKITGKQWQQLNYLLFEKPG